MGSTIRFILALSLLWQSAFGLGAGACAMSGSDHQAVRAGAHVCECCRDSDGNPIPCPMATNASVGCNCSTSDERQPANSPSQEQGKQLDRLLAYFPALSIVVAPALPPTLPRWERIGSLLGRGGHSVQSILCIWQT